jgi:hypothetical protein
MHETSPGFDPQHYRKKKGKERWKKMEKKCSTH